MLNTLEKEIFLYGNMDLYFSLKEIKNLDLNCLRELKHVYKEGWYWRFYKNFKSILSTREFDIVNNQDSFIVLLELLSKIIENCVKRQKIKLVNIDLENINYYLLVFYSLLKDVQFKIKSYNTHTSTEKIEKKFNVLFSSYLPYFETQNIIIDYVSPFEGNSWSSSWKVIYENKEFRLKNVDVFIDTYFYNQNLYYNRTMNENLEILEKRLVFVQKNAPTYYQEIIQPKLKTLSHKLYNIFPLKLIYKHYRNLINIDQEVYFPELYGVCEKNNISWFFSVLPIYLSSYILGFPIITCDIPSCKNIKKYIEDFTNLGPEKYYENISKINKKKIDLTVFNIPCGNTVEEDEILDLTLNKVIDYNMDDLMIFFNVGVYHVFTPPEFQNLVKKESNPYNRKPIPVFNNILENMRFRKKVTRHLNNREINVNLNNTMIENYQTLLDSLNSNKQDTYQEEENNGMDIFNSSFINFLVNSYNV